MRYLTFLFFLACFTTTAIAQEGFQPRSFETKDGHILPYQILYPKNYDRSQKYPIVLVLHGAGERGNDNQKQLTHGSKLFLKEENQTQFPAIVIFPQCAADSYWMSGEIDRAKQPIELSFDYPKKPNWPLKAAIELVKKLVKEEAVDKKRIYITGLSMGGMGTFEALSRYPKLFAAAAPICGGGNLEMTKKYAKRVPLWIFHGAVDAVVKVEYSRNIYAALQAHGADVKYTEYPGVNHNSWDNAFAEPTFLSWLFSHQKGKK
ncbi:MAG: prolyl oligopeptidase family serine peptidase [Spirosomataceae bacterium]